MWQNGFVELQKASVRSASNFYVRDTNEIWWKIVFISIYFFLNNYNNCFISILNNYWIYWITFFVHSTRLLWFYYIQSFQYSDYRTVKIMKYTCDGHFLKWKFTFFILYIIFYSFNILEWYGFVVLQKVSLRSASSLHVRDFRTK